MFVNGRNAQLSVNQEAEERWTLTFFPPDPNRLRLNTKPNQILQIYDMTFYDIALIKFIREGGGGIFIFIKIKTRKKPRTYIYPPPRRRIEIELRETITRRREEWRRDIRNGVWEGDRKEKRIKRERKGRAYRGLHPYDMQRYACTIRCPRAYF